MSPRILLVDDEANIRKMVSALLESEGFETLEAPNGQAALALVADDAPDAVLLDLMMPPGPDGLATLEQLKKRAPHLPVVMMSGKANLADAVRATKLGAFQFLEKPLTPEGILVALRGALELGRTLAENRRLHEQLGHDDPLVGTSVAMEELRAMIARVAPTESRVLITGESGTGKELVASAIHRQSARGGAGKPFVTVNSAAIPRDLVESEMFGHERGAFTGATERRQGRFELADGGTLFLDEVGDLSAEAQAKLLRVLETGVVERLGGERPFTVNVRVIAATNKDLAQAVRQRQFREDLWFRLNVLPIHIPPLRERPDDIPPLVRHCAARCAVRLGRSVHLDAGAVQLLAAYRWPGNVRELANIVERLAILATGDTISADDVARVIPHGQDGGRGGGQRLRPRPPATRLRLTWRWRRRSTSTSASSSRARSRRPAATSPRRRAACRRIAPTCTGGCGGSGSSRPGTSKHDGMTRPRPTAAPLRPQAAARPVHRRPTAPTKAPLCSHFF